MFKRHITALVFASLLVGQPAGAQSDMPPVAPSFQPLQAAPVAPSMPDSGPAPAPFILDQSVPEIPAVLPPPVPPRPPLCPAMAPAGGQPPAAPAMTVKPPLAWRAKANVLRNAAQATSTVTQASYEQAIMKLLSALPQFGLRVVMLNSKAGELLSMPIDGSGGFYIFTFAEMPPGTVTIKGAPAFTSKAPAAQAKVTQVLDALKAPLTARSYRQ